jgi:hypothetical protein
MNFGFAAQFKFKKMINIQVEEDGQSYALIQLKSDEVSTCLKF